MKYVQILSILKQGKLTLNNNLVLVTLVLMILEQDGGVSKFYEIAKIKGLDKVINELIENNTLIKTASGYILNRSSDIYKLLYSNKPTIKDIIELWSNKVGITSDDVEYRLMTEEAKSLLYKDLVPIEDLYKASIVYLNKQKENNYRMCSSLKNFISQFNLKYYKHVEEYNNTNIIDEEKIKNINYQKNLYYK